MDDLERQIARLKDEIASLENLRRVLGGDGQTVSGVVGLSMF